MSMDIGVSYQQWETTKLCWVFLAQTKTRSPLERGLVKKSTETAGACNVGMLDKFIQQKGYVRGRRTTLWRFPQEGSVQLQPHVLV